MKKYRKDIEDIILPDLRGQIENDVPALIKKAEAVCKEYQEAFYRFDATRTDLKEYDCNQGKFQQVSVWVAGIYDEYLQLDDRCKFLLTVMEPLTFVEGGGFQFLLDSVRDYLSEAIITHYNGVGSCLKRSFRELQSVGTFGPYTASGDSRLRHRLWKAVQGLRQLSEKTELVISDFKRLSLLLYQMTDDSYVND